MGRTHNQNLGKGLDVGTSFVRAAEQHGQEIVYRTERNAFIDIGQADYTETMLRRSGIEYVISEGQLYIVGNKAMEFANLLALDARRPFSRGIISPSEKEALPMIEMIVKAVGGSPERSGETLYYSIPGPPVDGEANLLYHDKTVQSILQRLGFTAKPINEGLAVVFSELSHQRFTGIGLSFGGGMVNVCVAYRSVPVLRFSLAMAGDWIDQTAALAVGETASLVCALKESFLDLSKREGLSKVEQALSISYDKLIAYVLEQLRKQAAKAIRAPELVESFTMVLGGGTALPRGFSDRFTQALREGGFPLEIGEVLMAKDPSSCVATGALIAAQADEEDKADEPAPASGVDRESTA
jgi:hypothetical protein